MKVQTSLLSLSAIFTLAVPVLASAQTTAASVQFNDSGLSLYSDAPWDMSTNVAVSTLTRMGVLSGNADGTFAPDRTLNRAEFMTIVMRLLGNSQSVALNCFPDVSQTAWYADAVCRAKAAGLVRGNAVVGVDASLWRFEPSRDIQYEEAVKVLATLYALPISGSTEGDAWYAPYVKAASDASIDIHGLTAGDRITRGEMAQLAVNFVAWSQGRLSELRNAENGSSSSISSSSMKSSSSSSSHSSSSSSSSVSSSSSASSIVSGDIRSHILLLGTTSPELASTDIFSNLEPVDINAVTVTFTNPLASISSLIIYDQSGAQIGTATAVNGSTNQFRAVISYGKLLLPYRQQRAVSVAARLKAKDSGGISGEVVQVQSVLVEGNGRWTNEAYSSSSTDTFTASQTTFATITSITNSGLPEALLTSGQGKILADLTVNANTPESQNQIRISNLAFTIDQAGGVTLSNVKIWSEDDSVSTPCTVGATTVTCLNIDPGILTVNDARRFKLIGDVAVPGSASHPLLQLVINDPGTSASPGDITWSDGVTTFTWVDMGQPVASGTVWR